MKLFIDYKNATILFLLLLMVATTNPAIAEEEDSEVSTAPTYEVESPSNDTIGDDGTELSGVEEDE